MSIHWNRNHSRDDRCPGCEGPLVFIGRNERCCGPCDTTWNQCGAQAFAGDSGCQRLKNHTGDHRQAYDRQVGPEAEAVDHPAHYGGRDSPYEAIKVIEAWGLGFNLGNAAKYICRAGSKGKALEDLEKARWYLDREIQKLKKV